MLHEETCRLSTVGNDVGRVAVRVGIDHSNGFLAFHRSLNKNKQDIQRICVQHNGLPRDTPKLQRRPTPRFEGKAGKRANLPLLPALPPKLGVNLPYMVEWLCSFAVSRGNELTHIIHLQTPFLGSSQACLMNLGNVELQKPMKSRLSSRAWGFGET
jgi:hypothetical protein